MNPKPTGLSRLVAFRARGTPGRRALVTPFGSRSFAELHRHATKLANVFIGAGLAGGDRVLLLCGNRPEFVETMIAGEMAGLSVVPLVYDLTPRELCHVIEDSKARAVIVDAGIESHIAAVPQATADMPLRLVAGGAFENFDSYDRTCDSAPATLPPKRSPGSPIFYTSGTTGRPKGVAGQRPHLSPLMQLLPEIYAFRHDGDSFLCAFPLYQPGVFNLIVLAPLVAGATAYLLANREPESILKTIADAKITHVTLSPNLFHLLREMGDERLRDFDFSSLRCILHGGSSCPVELKRWIIRRFGPIVTEYYAATEGGGVCITAEEWLKKPGSVGRPLPELQIRIIDEEGRPCAAGNPGQIYFHAAEGSRFHYLGDPLRTGQAYRDDHFTTGDIGYLDADGYLFLIGRDADIANIDEENVHPEEIDQVLVLDPAVADALSFSVPAEGVGERIVSWVRLRDPARTDASVLPRLRELCQVNLARFKRPALIEFVEALPQSLMGKKQRHRARLQFLAERRTPGRPSTVWR